ncbi:MAG TPA: hypothetical protein VKR32_11895, partial [Puia sp.]|nr:hypothetical protein [Puia sp.]
MKESIDKLDKLIQLITEKFPDERDLKHFPGISRDLILKLLDDSRSQLILLADQPDSVEIILLKRELAEIFKTLNKKLAGRFEQIPNDQFESILKSITKLKSQVRATYFSSEADPVAASQIELTKTTEALSEANAQLSQVNQVLTDLETRKNAAFSALDDANNRATRAKEDTINVMAMLSQQMTEQSNAVKDKISEVQTSATSLMETAKRNCDEILARMRAAEENSQAIAKGFEERQSNSIRNEERINQFTLKIEKDRESIESINQNVSGWQQEISKIQVAIQTSAAEYDKLNSSSKNLQKEIEETHEKIFGKKNEQGKAEGGYLQETEALKISLAAFLIEQEKKFQTQFNEINGLIEGATSVGLAKAYHEQKESYTAPIRLWSWIFILTMVATGVLSIFWILREVNGHAPFTMNDAMINLIRE